MTTPVGGVATSPARSTLVEQSPPATPAAVALLARLDTDHPMLAAVPARERLLAAAWLAGYRSARTRRAYALDLTAWLDWLHGLQVDVLAARRVHVDLWVRHLVDTGAASSSTARRLSALTSFYHHLITHDVLTANPATAVRRPRVDPDHTTTVGLDRAQARAFLAAADTDPGPARLRTAATARLLATPGPARRRTRRRRHHRPRIRPRPPGPDRDPQRRPPRHRRPPPGHRGRAGRLPHRPRPPPTPGPAR